ncbi:60S ribosomal protein L7-4-like isoform X2 [Durio zibethinus]|uniref:60S ribosomal protein L7-4-like isoform X2 n=1 Tax=Durio zibethinus TaxID=66656 RepID=A0A6P5XNC5_DURZI|nr:60S ribosomal protein L7-4-like isoform X2 [Durio zibethinus]
MGEEVKAVIPESLLKRRKRNEEWELAKKQELEAAKKKKVENRKLIYTRAKQYAKEYEAQKVERKAHLSGLWRVGSGDRRGFLEFLQVINRRQKETNKILDI